MMLLIGTPEKERIDPVIRDEMDHQWKEKNEKKYRILLESIFLHSIRVEGDEFDDGEYEKYEKERDLHTFERPIQGNILGQSRDEMREEEWHTRHNE